MISLLLKIDDCIFTNHYDIVRGDCPLTCAIGIWLTEQEFYRIVDCELLGEHFGMDKRSIMEEIREHVRELQKLEKEQLQHVMELLS